MMNYQLVPLPKETERQEGCNKHKLFVKKGIAANNCGIFDETGDLAISFVTTPPSEHIDAYELIIEKDAVTIKAENDRCFFYGLATLYQLTLQFGSTLPLLHITDSARVAHRAVQLCFGQVLINYKKDFVAKFIREMAILKATHLNLYIEFDYAFDCLPETHRKGQLNAESVREIITLAKKYFITVVPAVNLLGHSENLLNHQIAMQYMEYDRDKNGSMMAVSSALCPASVRFKDITRKVLEQIMRDFDSDIVHVGGDEVENLGLCKDCKPKAMELGKIGYYLDYFNFINDILKSHGRKMGLWSDQILYLSKDSRFWQWRKDEIDASKFDIIYKQLDRLRDNTIFYDWWYTGESLKTQQFFETNNLTYITTGSTSGCATLCTAISQSLFHHSLYSGAMKHGCYGILTADWYNCIGSHAEQQYFNLADGLAMSWCGCDDTFIQGQSKREFERAYSAIHYGVHDDTLIDYLHYSGDYESELLNLFGENYRGTLLKKNIYDTDNPLDLILSYGKFLEGEKLEHYRERVFKLERLWNAITWEKEHYSLKMFVIVHRHILSRIETFFRAYKHYDDAAKVQFTNKKEFKKQLSAAAKILRAGLRDYDDPIAYIEYCADVLGLENTSVLRVKQGKKNLNRLADFIASLRDGRRTLPTFYNIAIMLFHSPLALFCVPNLREWADEKPIYRNYDLDNKQYDIFLKFPSEINYQEYS